MHLVPQNCAHSDKSKRRAPGNGMTTPTSGHRPLGLTRAERESDLFLAFPIAKRPPQLYCRKFPTRVFHSVVFSQNWPFLSGPFPLTPVKHLAERRGLCALAALCADLQTPTWPTQLDALVENVTPAHSRRATATRRG